MDLSAKTPSPGATAPGCGRSPKSPASFARSSNASTTCRACSSRTRAAQAARAGHEVVASRGEVVDGDVALVLSSLVDYRRETAFAAAMRARGARVGFVGLAASKLPHLFEDSADFIVIGEPESVLDCLFQGEALAGRVDSPAGRRSRLAAVSPLGPHVATGAGASGVPLAARPTGGVVPAAGEPRAVRSSAPTARIAFSRPTVRDRWATSWTSSRSSARPRRGRHTSCFATRSSPRTATACWRSATALPRAASSSRSNARRGSTGSTRSCSTVMHRAGLRAMSFGVEAVSAVDAQEGRPAADPGIAPARHRRHVPAARRSSPPRSMSSGSSKTRWESITATIEYAWISARRSRSSRS